MEENINLEPKDKNNQGQQSATEAKNDSEAKTDSEAKNGSEEPVKDEQPGINRFGAIGWATLIYALVFGICLYRNLSGILTVVAAAATVIYICYCSARLQKCTGMKADALYGERAKSRKLYPYYAGIILLGISVFCTADAFIINVNYVGMFLLVLCVLLQIFCDDHAWGFGKTISAMFEMTFSPILYIDRSCRDYAAMKSTAERKKNSTVKYVVIGVLIAIPVALVVVALLASADSIFHKMVSDVFGNIHITGDIILFPLFVLGVFVYVYGMLAKMSTEGIDRQAGDRRNMEPVIGITFTGILTVVYLIFSVVQIMYLFAGGMLLPDGYSYAEYARQGFFQLLFVSFLNLLIVLLSVSIFRKNRVLDLVLTVMSACTYIMLASSAVRMMMYIKEYDLTYLRLLVLLALLLIAVEMAGVVIRIHRDGFPIMRYTVFAVGIIWIVFSFSRPGYVIAKYNISRMEERIAERRMEWENQVGDIAESESWDEQYYFVSEIAESDLRYLVSLGGDAAPALYELAEKLDGMLAGEEHEWLWVQYSDKVDIVTEYFRDIRNEQNVNGSIRGFNVAKYQAYVCARQVKDYGILQEPEGIK